jgi:hypothetical protein
MNPFPEMPERSIELPLGCKDLIDVEEVRKWQTAQHWRDVVQDQLAYMEGYLAGLIKSTRGSYSLWLFRFRDHGGIMVVRDDQLKDQVLFASWSSIVQRRNLEAFFAESGGVPISPPVGRWKTHRSMLYRLPPGAAAAAQFAGEVLRGGYGLPDRARVDLRYHEVPSA